MIKYHFKNKDITKEVTNGGYVLFGDKSLALAFSDEKESPCLTLSKTNYVGGVEVVTFCFAVKIKKK